MDVIYTIIYKYVIFQFKLFLFGETYPNGSSALSYLFSDRNRNLIFTNKKIEDKYLQSGPKGVRKIFRNFIKRKLFNTLSNFLLVLLSYRNIKEDKSDMSDDEKDSAEKLIRHLFICKQNLQELIIFIHEKFDDLFNLPGCLFVRYHQQAGEMDISPKIVDEFKSILEKVYKCKKCDNSLYAVTKEEKAICVIEKAFLKARYDPEYKLCEIILINNLKEIEKEFNLS